MTICLFETRESRQARREKTETYTTYWRYCRAKYPGKRNPEGEMSVWRGVRSRIRTRLYRQPANVRCRCTRPDNRISKFRVCHQKFLLFSRADAKCVHIRHTLAPSQLLVTRLLADVFRIEVPHVKTCACGHTGVYTRARIHMEPCMHSEG